MVTYLCRNHGNIEQLSKDTNINTDGKNIKSVILDK